MKVLKMQAWNHYQKIMLPPSDIGGGAPTYHECPDRDSLDGTTYLFFTGYRDIKDYPLFEDDVVRVKCGWGEEGFSIDSYYRVCISLSRGLSLLWLCPSDTKPDTQNQIMPGSLRFGDQLNVDHRDSNERLAIMDTHGENPTFGHRWEETRYSNDITKVGDVYQNPEYIEKSKEYS